MNRGFRSRPIAWLVTVACFLAAGVGCGSDTPDDGIDRSRFEAQVSDALGSTSEQSSCISERVYAAYDDAEIRMIYENGITALPGRVGPYVYAIVTCTMGEELQP